MVAVSVPEGLPGAANCLGDPEDGWRVSSAAVRPETTTCSVAGDKDCSSHAAPAVVMVSTTKLKRADHRLIPVRRRLLLQSRNVSSHLFLKGDFKQLVEHRSVSRSQQ